jgi:hypothetical protein
MVLLSLLGLDLCRRGGGEIMFMWAAAKPAVERTERAVREKLIILRE